MNDNLLMAMRIMSCDDDIQNLIQGLINQINSLKSELKKYPKVIFCKDCANTYCTKITMADKCKIWGHQPSPNGYCSRVRKRKENGSKK